jgi:hypothetical protein
MLSFKEWLLTQEKKKKDKKNERSTSQSNREIGNENKQGQTDRSDQEIESKGVFVFTEPS